LKNQALTDLLLNGVNLAWQPIADSLVDDAKDDGVQGAAGKHQLMKALTYLYYTSITMYVPVKSDCLVLSLVAAASTM